MGKIRQINIKNLITYYFYSDIIDLKKFKSNLFKIDKKSYKNISIYNIRYCENIQSVNPLYLRVDHATGYIEEKNGSKYLIFDPTDKNKE